MDMAALIRRMVKDLRLRTLVLAGFSLGLNLLYTLYHGYLGWQSNFAWFLCSCLYYGLLCLMRLPVLLAQGVKSLPLEHAILRLTGLLLALLSPVLLAGHCISLTQSIATRHGEITMITLATYTFAKLTLAIVKSVRQAKEPSPLMKALRSIGYAEALVSVYTMQRSMLVSFGTVAPQKILLFNLFTGSVVCVMTLGLGLTLLLGKQPREHNKPEQ